MQELIKSAEELQSQIAVAAERLKINELVAQKAAIDEQVLAPDFWDNPVTAQKTVKQQAKLDARITPWQTIIQSASDVVDLARLGDISLMDDLSRQLNDAQQRFEQLKEELKFAGPHDDGDAIVSIYAGAGGTDAQDWAAMLQRMYVRWAETHQYDITVIDESTGDEAGIKSATLEISGAYAYGKLRGEHGVHRLVRLSPFNADSLRQTSFAKVDILPKIDQPDDLIVDEKDLRVDVYRAGGHGGQSVNTTDSAVRITHQPTGISVAIQNERSQLQNKEMAMTILRSRLAQLQMEQHQEALSSLKGPNQSAEWGNQIRSYVLHPYKQVKDLRTRHESSDPDGVLDGKLDSFIEAYLDYSLGE